MINVPEVKNLQRFRSFSRPLRLVVAGLVFLLAFTTLNFTLRTRSLSSFAAKDYLLLLVDKQQNKPDPLRIWILESAGWHDEVMAALVHAFGNQENAELRLYLKRQRYQVDRIINNFSLEAPITAIKTSQSLTSDVIQLPSPHVLVSTTCEIDLVTLTEPLRALLENGATYLFCVFHHADRWAHGQQVHGEHVSVAREWLERGLLEFIGLSQHTTDYLVNKIITKWDFDIAVTARTLPPVFPVDLLELGQAGDLSLAIQGDYSSERRNYQHIFRQLGGVVQKVKSSAGMHESKTVFLHVVGHGTPPQVPEDVRANVVFDQGLSYPDFYTLLSRSFSILPAFTSDGYLDQKASSTVPASLIAGAPLVASEELLAAYSYLPRDSAWISRPGEDEMAVVARVIGDREAYLEKRDRARSACTRLTEENTVHVREWITEAIRKIGGGDEK